MLPVLASLIWSTHALAGFDEGVFAFLSGDYAEAFGEFRPLAERGDVLAQVNLGVMYHTGQVTPQDFAKAFHWCLQAANQGDAVAQFNTGIMYLLGQGMPRDYV